MFVFPPQKASECAVITSFFIFFYSVPWPSTSWNQRLMVSWKLDCAQLQNLILNNEHVCPQQGSAFNICWGLASLPLLPSFWSSSRAKHMLVLSTYVPHPFSNIHSLCLAPPDGLKYFKGFHQQDPLRRKADSRECSNYQQTLMGPCATNLLMLFSLGRMNHTSGFGWSRKKQQWLSDYRCDFLEVQGVALPRHPLDTSNPCLGRRVNWSILSIKAEKKTQKKHLMNLSSNHEIAIFKVVLLGIVVKKVFFV